MTTAPPIEVTLEGAGFVSEAALLLVIFIKQRWRTLPVLAVLIIYVALEDVTLSLASRMMGKLAYRWAFWAFAVGDYALQIALIGQIALALLRPMRTWIPGALSKFLLFVLSAALLALCVVMWLVAPHETIHETVYRRMSLFTTLFTSLCFLFLSIIANGYRLPRRDHVKALGEGLTAWSVACLIGDIALNTDVSERGVILWGYLRSATWIMVLLYWATALWSNEKTTGFSLFGVDNQLSLFYRGIPSGKSEGDQ